MVPRATLFSWALENSFGTTRAVAEYLRGSSGNMTSARASASVTTDAMSRQCRQINSNIDSNLRAATFS